jgi:WS/DGAT/MGAT family acyltransferase
MTALDQLMKLAGNLPLDKLSQYLQLDRLPLDKLAGNAIGKIDELKNRERMSSVDTAWLRMDTPTNLMMIVGVMMFDGPPDLARIRRTLDARLSRYARFRQRVLQDPSGAYWVHDEHFDIGNHVHVVNLPGASGTDNKQALEEYVAALTTQSLDFNKPLWHMTVVERYEGDGVVGHALIVRIHHCIADGIALIGVMYSLFDEVPDTPEEGQEPDGLRRLREKREAKRAARAELDFMEQLFAPLSDATSKALSVSGDFAARYMDMMSNPEKFADYAKIAAAVTAEIAELATMPNDSATRFKGKPTAVKRVAWSAPLPLTDIKAVCKVLGVSVNDILLASVAGAMRSYLAQKGDDTEGVEVRGFVPVNLRPRGAEHKLGNHFGLVALVLPVGIENPFVRLFDVKRRMDELKNSYQAALSMGILGTVGFLPRTIQKQVLDMFSSKGSAVMTNVPGPQQALHMAGARLAQQMFWVPQSGDIGVGVSILSYNGQVQFGLVTDRKFVDDPQAIVDRFEPEFEKLVLWLLLEGAPPADSSMPMAAEPHVPTGLDDMPSKPAPTKASRPMPGGKKAKPATRKKQVRAAAATTPAAEAAEPAAEPAPAAPPRMKKKGLLARARG